MKKLFVVLLYSLSVCPVCLQAADDPARNPGDRPTTEPGIVLRRESVTNRFEPDSPRTAAAESTSQESQPRLLSAGLMLPLTETEKARVIFHELLVSSASLEIANRERAQLAAFGLKIKRRQWLPKLGIVASVYLLPAGADPLDVQKQVQRQYPQLPLEFNQRYFLQGNAADQKQRSARYYGQRMLGLDENGCEGFTGQIAMMDAALNRAPPSFPALALELKDVTGADTPVSEDHATAVVSQLGGLLPKAQILAVNVYRNGEDAGLETRTDWLLAGFEAVLAHDPRPAVLNMSFGGNNSRLLKLAIEKLRLEGIRLVAAAGNGGVEASPVFPAAYEGVTAVTAVDVKEQVWVNANRGEYVDFAAPGVDLWLPGADGGARFVSGTSFAAPWVTAAAALASDEQWAKPALLARDLGKPGRDSQFGYGLIQLGSLCH